MGVKFEEAQGRNKMRAEASFLKTHACAYRFRTRLRNRRYIAVLLFLNCTFLAFIWAGPVFGQAVMSGEELVERILGANSELSYYEATVTSRNYGSHDEFLAAKKESKLKSKPGVAYKFKYDSVEKKTKLKAHGTKPKKQMGSQAIAPEPFFTSDILKFLSKTKDISRKSILGEEAFRGKDCYLLEVIITEKGYEVRELILVEKKHFKILKGRTFFNSRETISSELDYIEVRPGILLPKEKTIHMHAKDRVIHQTFSDHTLTFKKK